jgi:hypothetical protein
MTLFWAILANPPAWMSVFLSGANASVVFISYASFLFDFVVRNFSRQMPGKIANCPHNISLERSYREKTKNSPAKGGVLSWSNG